MPENILERKRARSRGGWREFGELELASHFNIYIYFFWGGGG